jgi:hypothetical protein
MLQVISFTINLNLFLTIIIIRFSKHSLDPAIVPVPYCLLYMIQSGKYIFAPDFVGYNKKLDLEETEVLWDIVHFPKSATIDTILEIVFDPRAYGLKVTILLMIILIQNIIGYN